MRQTRQNDDTPVEIASPLFTTEFTLLVELCRLAFSSGDPEHVDELGKSADWQRLVRLARFHRVQGLVALALRRIDLAPPTEVGVLSADAETIAVTGLRQAHECHQIHALAAAGGIPLLFLKGLTVGALAYDNPFLKTGWDIDLLVDASDLPRAAELLRSRGFQLVIPRHGSDLASWHGGRKESLWTRSGDEMHVDLHTRLADNPRLISGIDIRSPVQNVEVAAGIALPTLIYDELFAYLCVHGASSAWFRLKWITDVVALLSRCSPGEIERLYGRSQQLGAARAAGQALLIADSLYGTLSGTNLRHPLRDSRACRWLADTALRQLAAEPIEPTSIPLGTWRIHLTQLFLQPGIAFKLTELGRQLRDATS